MSFLSIKALQEGLRGLGYIEGQNIVLEYRFADGTAERLPGLVAELIHLQVQTVPSPPLLWWGVRATLPCKS
jgi:putative ABC transport system substrate-binding protein